MHSPACVFWHPAQVTSNDTSVMLSCALRIILSCTGKEQCRFWNCLPVLTCNSGLSLSHSRLAAVRKTSYRLCGPYAGSEMGDDPYETRNDSGSTASTNSDSDPCAPNGTYKAWVKANGTPISKGDWTRCAKRPSYFSHLSLIWASHIRLIYSRSSWTVNQGSNMLHMARRKDACIGYKYC